ncbi:MAG TPA: sugar ABC transporter ATP-binding protein [Pseudonocardia sp.]
MTTPSVGSGAAGEAPPDRPLLRLDGIAKRYGVTTALDGATLAVERGEVVGLIGHNGAGKSTLMRVIVGLTTPDAGTVEVDGEPVGPGYSIQQARQRGIRIAYQELSLAPELSARENVLLSAPAVAGRRWQRRSEQLLREALDAVFPGHRIPLRRPVRELSLARQQMLEIAAATLAVGDPLALLILDEPTSALGRDQAANLFAYLATLRERGVSTILISHKLPEILGHTDRVVVMRDGAVVARQPTAELDHDRVVALMGGIGPSTSPGGDAAAAVRSGGTADGEPLLVTDDVRGDGLHGVSIAVRPGEVVGLAGLDGQGQQQLLQHVWRHRGAGWGRAGRRRVRLRAGAAFVTGDRVRAGVFPLWTVGQNIAVGVMRELSRGGVSQRAGERAVVERWMDRLAVRGTPGTPIPDLSGGNQQKALIARALASSARVVLLDDPFRGVDVETKQQVYRLLREEAAAGRSFVWFTTENAELAECDRVYVMAAGRVVAELAGEEITEDAVIAASFARPAEAERAAAPDGGEDGGDDGDDDGAQPGAGTTAAGGTQDSQDAERSPRPSNGVRA